MRNFALIGAAGFIAPRHMRAIKDTGNNLLAALDKHDNVGILDSYFPDTHFFTEFERFDRHLDKLKRNGHPVEFITVCSPNYLHDSHVRYTLRYGANAICEKPLVLNPWNLDALEQLEQETKKRISTILQLRLHPVVMALKKKIDEDTSQKTYDVDLCYVTSRGNWYMSSWKGDNQKSGGIILNIGIHFFDMLLWLFGKAEQLEVHFLENARAQGVLKMQRAHIRWFLSVDYSDVPTQAKQQGKRTYRSLKIEGQELEFSDGFTELHTISYEHILLNGGFGIADVRPSIELAYRIRSVNAHK